MTIRRLTNLCLIVACAATLTACFDKHKYDDELFNAGNKYINLTIAVNGSQASTRGPEAGESDANREVGFERENKVTGITFIMYQSDGTGINTTADPALAVVEYFPVSGRATAATPYEVEYTTGNQRLPRTTLNYSQKIGVVVIANADLTSDLKGKHLSDLKTLTINKVYDGADNDAPTKCGNFVMASRTDYIIDFNTEADRTAYGDDWLYTFKTPITVERLAARIDFQATNAKYGSVGTDIKKGYVYSVEGSATDKFLVTGLMPFNLLNGTPTYGSEYLLKHLRTAIDDETTTTLLKDETATLRYVKSFGNDSKTTATKLANPLDDLYAKAPDKLSDMTGYYKTVTALHDAITTTDGGSGKDGSEEDVIVGYAMENTLAAGSPLYYWATGLAIEGYYYKNGTGAGVPYVYFGYLRHYGSLDHYDINSYQSPLGKADKMPAPATDYFSVVRNNIYRVSINKVDQKSTLELSIKVKMWDPYIHDYIYM